MIHQCERLGRQRHHQEHCHDNHDNSCCCIHSSYIRNSSIHRSSINSSSVKSGYINGNNSSNNSCNVSDNNDHDHGSRMSTWSRCWNVTKLAVSEGRSQWSISIVRASPTAHVTLFEPVAQYL